MKLDYVMMISPKEKWICKQIKRMYIWANARIRDKPRNMRPAGGDYFGETFLVNVAPSIKQAD